MLLHAGRSMDYALVSIFGFQESRSILQGPRPLEIHLPNRLYVELLFIIKNIYLTGPTWCPRERTFLSFKQLAQ